jgi:hypothetical protein
MPLMGAFAMPASLTIPAYEAAGAANSAAGNDVLRRGCDLRTSRQAINAKINPAC